MELNEYDLNELDKLAKAIDSTLEITDLYISGDMLRTFKMIIRKLKRDNKMEFIKIEFQCPECQEFYYKDIKKEVLNITPNCRSCKNSMVFFKVIE